MKPTLALLLLGALVAWQAPAHATEVGVSKRVGVGVIVGNPTGLSGKVYLGGRRHGIDLALAYSTWGRSRGSFYAHGSYLWHPSDLIELPEFVLPWYVGLGAVVGAFRSPPDHWPWDQTVYVGGRVPAGLAVDFTAVPAQIFIEGALIVYLFPGTSLGVGVALGGRWFF